MGSLAADGRFLATWVTSYVGLDHWEMMRALLNYEMGECCTNAAYSLLGMAATDSESWATEIAGNRGGREGEEDA